MALRAAEGGEHALPWPSLAAGGLTVWTNEIRSSYQRAVYLGISPKEELFDYRGISLQQGKDGVFTRPLGLYKMHEHVQLMETLRRSDGRGAEKYNAVEHKGHEGEGEYLLRVYLFSNQRDLDEAALPE
jgi:hypothetical protein